MLAELAFELLALALGIGDPLGGDGDGVFVVEQGAVVGKLAVAVGDLGAQPGLAFLGCGVGFGYPSGAVAGVVDVVVVEQPSEPLVEAGQERFLLDVDVAGMMAVAVGVVLGELAAVVGATVVPVALHPPPAHAAVHPSGEHVVTVLRRRAGARSLPGTEHRLHRVEQLAADEWCYRQRAIAARRTRSAKHHEQVTDLMARWQAEIEAGPYTIARIAADVDRNRHQRITPELGDRDLDRLAAQLLAPDGRLAADKVFCRRDVIVAAAPHLFGLDPTTVDRLADRVLVHPDAVELEPFGGVRERVWAPRCVIDTEHAIEERAWSRHHTRTTLPVAPVIVDEAIKSTEATLGRRLTPSQRATVRGICGSNRSLDVVVGLAGSGKTTALDAVRLAHEHHGHRVIGTATSGQAARTIGRDAGIESRTVASLLARLERGSLSLDRRTLVVLDEAGMTDDHDLDRLLDHTTRAHAKLVLVGDPRQLSAVGPGGGLEALVRQFDGHIWQITDNIRQTDLTEREALAELRHGDISQAIDWLARHDRIVAGTDRAETVGAVIDGWLADIDAGVDTVMLAWRRANVDALNHLARHAYAERGWLTGPEITAPGGRHYRQGDRIVTLAPYAGLAVTSETGTIEQVHPDFGALTIRFDDGRHVLLPPTYAADNRLAHGYAITVHRSQGATVDTTHYLEDGGGRELAYVALSRARHRSTVYTHADDLDTALDDLQAGWTTERRQHWITDRTTPLDPDLTRAPARFRDQGLELDLF